MIPMSFGNIKTLSLMGLTVLATAILLFSSSPVYAEGVDNDQGEVTYYTYTCNFAYEGTNAQSIEWDFGFNNPDGTRAKSTEWNPQGIVFPGKGEYTVTQKVSNTVGTYVSQIVVNIMGTPEIRFDTQGGSSIDMQLVKVGERIVIPENPTKSGYVFGGWYLESECTTPADLNVPASVHATYYAKWNSVTPGTPDDDDGSGDTPGNTPGDDNPVKPGEDGDDTDDTKPEDNEDGPSTKDIVVNGAISAIGLAALLVNLRRVPYQRSRALYVIAIVCLGFGLGSILIDMGILNLPGGE